MAWICSWNVEIHGSEKKHEQFEYNTSFDDRFVQDKLAFENSECIVVLDGVLLNKAELLSKSKKKTLAEYIQSVVSQENFYSELRGPFSGFIYRKSSEQLTAFGNQTGDTCAFWQEDSERFCVSSDFNMVFDACKDAGVCFEFDETAANHLLSLGYVVEGHTVARQISRTQPGEAVVLTKGGFANKHRYHFFDNCHADTNMSVEDAVAKVDVAFRLAVKRCFDKDIEYGYSHLTDMSGGLDSRITNRVARALGYKDIVNISYSQNGSREFQCASRASLAMHNELLYKQLDDIAFLYDVERIVHANYGLSVYYGITGGQRLLEEINFRHFGLEHTGMLGDAVVGSFSRTSEDTSIDIKAICYTDFIAPVIQHAGEYANKEQFCMYYRGFQGAVMTHYIRREFTEAVSPFMDVEFLQACFNIPLSLRCGDRLYWTWLDSRYPDISHLECTHERPKTVSFSKDRIYRMIGRNFRRKIIRCFKAIGLWRIVSPTGSMNPFEQWYAESAELRNYVESYYRENIRELCAYENTYETAKKVFKGAKTLDKLSVISVLGTYKVYFGKEKSHVARSESLLSR